MNISRIAGRLAAVAAIAAVDQGAGIWARRALSPTHVDWLAKPYLGLQLLDNRGAIFGIGSGRPEWVFWASLIGSAVFLAASLASDAVGWPLAVMAGGGLGNWVNRWRYGYVIDYVRVSHWPGIFNLADVALHVGLIWLLYHLLVRRRDGAPKLRAADRRWHGSR